MMSEDINRLVGELAALGKDHGTMIQELKVINASMYSMLAAHAEDLREAKRMRKSHERLLASHEETLRLHYRWLQEMREKER